MDPEGEGGLIGRLIDELGVDADGDDILRERVGRGVNAGGVDAALTEGFGVVAAFDGPLHGRGGAARKERIERGLAIGVDVRSGRADEEGGGWIARFVGDTATTNKREQAESGEQNSACDALGHALIRATRRMCAGDCLFGEIAGLIHEE